MTVLVGIDKGTTMTKTVVFDADDGTALGEAARKTPARHPRPEWHEEVMDGTWEAIAGTVREALEASGTDPDDVAGVGVSSHMGGLWALDGHGEPVRDAICWTDSRAVGVLDGWEDDGTLETFVRISGNAPVPGMPAPLLCWLRDHEPDALAAIRHVLLPKDYVNHRLTGELHTDETDLSFVPCDIRERKPSRELFSRLGIEDAAGLFPEVVASEQVVGTVHAEAAAATGLREGTPVVAGLGDAAANSIGVGAVDVGQAATVIGTSFMNNVTVDEPIFEPDGVGFLFLMPDGRWQRLLANTGGGTLGMDWFVDTIAAAEPALAGHDRDTLLSELEARAARVRPLPGVVFHPYLNTSGVTAPFHAPHARGSLFGLSASTTRAELLRAVYEGVALSMTDCYRAMPCPVTEIRMTGGGARSRLWCQICADAVGRELVVPRGQESGALGAAVAAGVGTGVYGSWADGVAKVIAVERTHEPDPEAGERYAQGYELFRAVRERLTDVYKLRTRALEATA